MPVAQAQFSLIWNGQEKSTIKEYWYPEGDQSAVQLWSSQEIWHDSKGRPILGVMKSEEGNGQRVNFRYNPNGDIIERIHRMDDSTVMIYTWKYQYDEQGRKTEESAFDHEEKLIAQTLNVYNEEGQLTDQAVFVRRMPEYQSWQYRDEEDGQKMHEARYLSYGPRNFYFNWSERVFLEYLNPFSLVPGSDVYQRYKYHYNSEGRIAKTELFDQMRNLIEADEYFYDNKGRVRSIKSDLPMDSSAQVWDLQYGDRGEVVLGRTVDLVGQSTNEYFKIEYEMNDDQLAVRRVMKVNNISDHYFYNPNGTLQKRERRDLFNALLEIWFYSEDGRISENQKFIENEVLEVSRKYSYEP